MSFGDILDQWERKSRDEKNSADISGGYRDLMNSWLDENPSAFKEEDLSRPGRKNPSRKTVRRMAPQETIDLHGYTVNDALGELTAFLQRSKRRGLKKVLIIHGKGNHSESGESILRKEVRSFIAQSPLCGEHGVPQPAYGGEGAVWVILR